MSIRARLTLTVIAVAGVVVLAGCGERPQVIDYKQGQYQGKADQRPWEGAPFNGDQRAWELALKDRAQTQNEYKRTN